MCTENVPFHKSRRYCDNEELRNLYIFFSPFMNKHQCSVRHSACQATIFTAGEILFSHKGCFLYLFYGFRGLSRQQTAAKMIFTAILVTDQWGYRMWTCIKCVTNVFPLLKQFLWSYVRLIQPASLVEKRSPSSRFTSKRKYINLDFGLPKIFLKYIYIYFFSFATML